MLDGRVKILNNTQTRGTLDDVSLGHSTSFEGETFFLFTNYL